VTERFETRLLTEMESVHAASRTAWERDPIAQAPEIGLSPPPPLPEDIAAAEPSDLVGAFRARAGYGGALATTGYVGRPVYFSQDERAALKEAADLGRSPEERAALAASIVAGFGRDAPRALAEIGADDVFAHMGGLAAVGGSPALVAEAFRGQQALKDNLTVLPEAPARRGIVDETFGDLFAGDTPLEGRIVRAAEAVYAGRARGVDPKSREGERLFRAALQEVLGAGVTPRGEQTGGVQSVRRVETLLPMGVTGDAASTALDMAKPEALRAASLSGGAPMYAGAEPDARAWAGVRLRAIGNDRYALYREVQGQRYDLTDSETGGLYVMSLTRLIAEAGR
jgi:hypothetical protein